MNGLPATLILQLDNFAKNHPLPAEHEQPRQFPKYDGRRSTLSLLTPQQVQASIAGFRIAADEIGLLRLIPSTELRNA